MSGFLVLLFVMALFGLFIPMLLYIFPFILLVVVVLALISAFSGKRNSRPQDPGASVKRHPDAIDVEYTESKVTDNDHAIDQK